MPRHSEKRAAWTRKRLAALDGNAIPFDRAVLLFFRRLAPRGECLIWTGYAGSDGYGSATFDGRLQRVHRIAYQLAFGPIPPGLHIDHTCHNPATCKGGVACVHRLCCNPDHLEAVTNVENILRGGGFTAVNARKTHCKRGHEFTPENIYTQPGKPGTRVCRECVRGQRQRWVAKNPEKARKSQYAASKRYVENNRDQVNAAQRALRARKRAV